ncbi:helix-turn-helix transcriptional regulator, partial [Streptococcus pneumoniae]
MSTLAEKFRLKRKELRLSQQTLAEGICEQSQISKIERGHFIPSADLLFKLSQRL